MGRVVDFEDLRERFQTRLPVEGFRHCHIQNLRIRKLKGKGREFVALCFQIEVLDVVDGGMTENELVFPLQQLFDLRIKRLEIGIFFKIVVIVRQNDAVAAAIGQVKFSVRVDEDILFPQNIEVFVRHAIAEDADLRHIFINAGALDVEKNVFHKSRFRGIYPAVAVFKKIIT